VADTALKRVLVATLPALLLAGCGDEPIAIPSGALSEVHDITGSSSPAASPSALASAEVDRLGAMANVEEDVLASVAPSLTEHDIWTRAMDGLRTIYEEAPEGVHTALVDVACEASTGRVYTDLQLHYEIFQRVSGFDEQEINGLTRTTSELYGVLYEAVSSGQAEDRAVAVLTCQALDGARG
jgi:hypothetical protein